MERILILVDVQNVFYGSKSFSGGKDQVDYAQLTLWLENEMRERSTLEAFPIGLAHGVLSPHVEFTKLGYVVQTPRYNGTRFFAFLRKIGYSLRVRSYDEAVDSDEWKGTVASMMQMDLLEHTPRHDVVVVVSGSGVFEPAFRAIRENWPDTYIYLCGFEDTIHEVYTKEEDIIDDILILGNDVMRNRGSSGAS